jgi:hypothetical protein
MNPALLLFATSISLLHPLMAMARCGRQPASSNLRKRSHPFPSGSRRSLKSKSNRVPEVAAKSKAACTPASPEVRSNGALRQFDLVAEPPVFVLVPGSPLRPHLWPLFRAWGVIGLTKCLLVSLDSVDLLVQAIQRISRLVAVR